MSSNAVKSVTISKTVNAAKTDAGTLKQIKLTKVQSAPADNKMQAANQDLLSAQASAVQDDDQEAEFVILSDKYIVEAEFLEEIESRFMDIYPSLLEGVEYTPAELVGEVYWAALIDVGQRLAILCLKHLATEDDVPLCDLTCVCCGITRFEIV